mmetsp:Transcript_2467/g.7867  ORF Transcript_2467/g.7867 Transcript_2467/m.7867 type:complete len:273 (+) Transcript_2467:894-1712(+)
MTSSSSMDMASKKLSRRWCVSSGSGNSRKYCLKRRASTSRSFDRVGSSERPAASTAARSFSAPSPSPESNQIFWLSPTSSSTDTANTINLGRSVPPDGGANRPVLALRSVPPRDRPLAPGTCSDLVDATISSYDRSPVPGIDSSGSSPSASFPCSPAPASLRSVLRRCERIFHERIVCPLTAAEGTAIVASSAVLREPTVAGDPSVDRRFMVPIETLSTALLSRSGLSPSPEPFLLTAGSDAASALADRICRLRDALPNADGLRRTMPREDF